MYCRGGLNMQGRDVLQGRVEYARQGCIAGKGCIVGTCHVEANVQ